MDIGLETLQLMYVLYRNSFYGLKGEIKTWLFLEGDPFGKIFVSHIE